MMIRPTQTTQFNEANQQACGNFYHNNISTNYILIDKIGLKIPTVNLNKEKCASLKIGLITVVFWGETSQINIHAEYLPHVTNHLQRVYCAVRQLYKNGFFNIPIDTTLSPIDILRSYFIFGELEIAFDFIGYKPTIQFNPEYFRRCFDDTLYSNDYKKTRRKRDGRSLSKSMQHSFLTYYNKGNLLQAEFPYYRFEIRFQGKYAKRDLTTFRLLDGESYEVYNKLNNKIISNCNNILGTNSITVSSAEMPNYPLYFNIFINSISNLAKKSEKSAG
jgi:hypothetical protein